MNAIDGGKYSPSPEAAVKIACVFSVSLDDVFQYPANALYEDLTGRLRVAYQLRPIS